MNDALIPTIRWAQRQGAADSPLTRNVLVALATHRDMDGDDCLSVPRLTAWTGYSSRSVRRALAELERKNLVRRSPRRSDSGSPLSDRIELVQGDAANATGGRP